jgi:hypothetical protein
MMSHTSHVMSCASGVLDFFDWTSEGVESVANRNLKFQRAKTEAQEAFVVDGTNCVVIPAAL